MVYGLYVWLSFDRPRGRSPSGLSKLKPPVYNPVDHKQRYSLTVFFGDRHDKQVTNQKAADSSRSSLAIYGTLFSKRSFGMVKLELRSV